MPNTSIITVLIKMVGLISINLAVVLMNVLTKIQNFFVFRNPNFFKETIQRFKFYLFVFFEKTFDQLYCTF